MADANEEKKEEAPKSKKGKGKMFIIIGLVAAVVLLGAGAGAYVMMSGSDEGHGDGKSKSDSKAEKTAHGDKSSGSGEEGKQGPPENIYKFDTPFFVTLADTKLHRILQFSLSVEFNDEEKIVEVDRYQDKFRDSIYSEVSTRTRAEIQTPEGKERLRRDLIHRFESLLESPGAISNIYFPDYVLPPSR